MELSKTRKLAEDTQAKLKKTEADLRDLTVDMKKYNATIGTIGPEGLDGELKQLRQRVVSVTERGGEISASETQTLMGLFAILEGQKNRLERQVKEQADAAKTEKDQLKESVATEQAKVKEKQTLVDQREADIKQKDDAIKEADEQRKREAGTLRAALKQARDEKEALEAEKNEKIRLLEHSVVELQKQLQKIREEVAGGVKQGVDFKPEKEIPDGKVILVDREAGIVLDIGQKKGVRAGLRFQVYNEKADGTRINVGEIEVKTVYPEISRAILLGEQDDPVQVVHKGDVLINPAFHPGRAKVFVADTPFDAAKKQAFRDALAEYGSVLEDDVSGRTDYLIIGTQPGKLMERAQQFGVVMIREEDLNRFLGR